ncbi:MAG: hypothetical protein IH840_07705 [Candidatus Heimdallarchaeota archaeon]|nr:hypothetical protein [Candidatus Heimdallarchaeota archaeon]
MPRMRYLEFKPLWARQDEETKFLGIILLISFIGFFLVLWTFSFYFVGFTIERISGSYFSQVPWIIQFISSFEGAALVAMISTALIVSLATVFHPVFSDLNLSHEWISIKDEIQNTMLAEDEEELSIEAVEKESNKYIAKELGTIFLYGVLAGFYLLIFYFFSFIFLFLFLFLIFIYFIPIVHSTYIALSLSVFLISLWIINRKTAIIGKEENIPVYDQFTLTERTAEIILSNEAPIICPGCRSYIVATTVICKICGETIE